jgi:hypothetical protein
MAVITINTMTALYNKHYYYSHLLYEHYSCVHTHTHTHTNIQILTHMNAQRWTLFIDIAKCRLQLLFCSLSHMFNRFGVHKHVLSDSATLLSYSNTHTHTLAHTVFPYFMRHVSSSERYWINAYKRIRHIH